MSSVAFFDIPGTQGPQGATGATGPAGPVGEIFVASAGVASAAVGAFLGFAGSGVVDVALKNVPGGSAVVTITVPPVTGPTGPQGATGSQGAQGSQGAVGPQGTQGASGASGAQGATGPPGAQGAIGPQGASGASGAVGAQGAQGAVGVVGPQGASGASGAPGASGAVGAQGAQGAIGPQGVSGASGAVGAQGPQGFQGSIGPAGSAAHFIASAGTASAVIGPFLGFAGSGGIATTLTQQGGSAIVTIAATSPAPGALTLRDLGFVFAADLLNGPQTLYSPAVGEFVTPLAAPDGYVEMDHMAWDAVPYSRIRIGGIAAVDPLLQLSITVADNIAGVIENSGLGARAISSDGSPIVAVLQTEWNSYNVLSRPPAWSANHPYVNTDLILAGSHVWSAGGGTTGSSIPDFAGNEGPGGGNTLVDGSVTWTDEGAIPTVGAVHVVAFTASLGAQGSAASAVTLRGPQGPSGAVGPQGAQGAAGASGAPGIQGAQGAQGLQGVTGVSASANFVASAGTASAIVGPFLGIFASGAASAQLSQQGGSAVVKLTVYPTPGPVGLTGPQGGVGASGASGASGAQGATGAQGPQGAQGATGTPGSQGAQGAPGTGGTGGVALVASGGTTSAVASGMIGFAAPGMSVSVSSPGGGSAVVTFIDNTPYASGGNALANASNLFSFAGSGGASASVTDQGNGSALVTFTALPPQGPKVVKKTQSYVIQQGDNGQVVSFTGVGLQATLPAPTPGMPWCVTITCDGAVGGVQPGGNQAGPLYITAASAMTISGAGSALVLPVGGSITVFSNGANYEALNNNTWPNFRDQVMAHSNAYVETYSRGQSTLTSKAVNNAGAPDLTALVLPAGLTIGHLGTFCQTTPTAPTHWFLFLTDNNFNVLATTADQLSTAIPSNSLIRQVITTTTAGSGSTYTTPYSGIYYVGMANTAGTGTTIACMASLQGYNGNICQPVIGGTGAGTLTTPPKPGTNVGGVNSSGNTGYYYVGP